MSLYHKPKGHHQQDPSYRRDGAGGMNHNDMALFDQQQMMAMMAQRSMDIPSVIVVPQRPCRVTSTMAQHYRDMPGAGAEISPSSRGGGGMDGSSSNNKSKPWQVDMAKKSYTNSSSNRRRFTKKKSSTRHRRGGGEQLSSTFAQPPVSSVVFNTPCGGGAMTMQHPEVDGSWNHVNDDYPSDEEHGFGGGGGLSSRGSSPASSTHTNGSSFGGIVLKGYYGGRSRRV